MTQDTQQSETGLILPEFAQQIAEANNMWAYLEHYIVKSIWDLAMVYPALGACMTSQMYSTNSKLSCLLALLKLRKVDKELITKVNKFKQSYRDAQDARNRIAHDLWLNDREIPENMGRLIVTAQDELEYTIQNLSLDDLKQEVGKIEKRMKQMKSINADIIIALLTLPDMSLTELHPLSYSHEQM